MEATLLFAVFLSALYSKIKVQNARNRRETTSKKKITERGLSTSKEKAEVTYIQFLEEA